MAATYPLEHTSRYDYNGSVDTPSRPRHYDSFVVRLWQDEGSDAMLRVEVQHVQAGLSIEAVQVPLDWILPEITSCLQSARGGQAHAGPDETR
jgi:hypothetical protein